MKLTKQIIQIGGSLGVTIDKYVLKKLKIKKGDVVEVEVKQK